MKKSLLTIISLCFFSFADAQIAKWLIEPKYDGISVANGVDAIIADSAGSKIMWSFDGKRMAETTNMIMDFKEDLSVLTKSNKTNIEGILKENGEIIRLEYCNVAHDYPFYSCEKLLVQKGEYFRFIDKKGGLGHGRYIQAYPYFNGYASCQTFMNFEKFKDPYFLLLNNKEEIVQFSFDGKDFDLKDVDFISSVNDENIAIVVIKRKLYKFNGKNGALTPVFATESETNLKNQAKLDGEFVECCSTTVNNTSVLTAKCGKNNFVSFEFDNMLRPISFKAGETLKEYKFNVEKKKEYASSLSVSSKNNKYGLYWGDKEMLPPQFDQLLTRFDNKALVKLNGKYGMLEIDKDLVFTLKINDGEDVPFLHQKYKTNVVLDMPRHILAEKTYLEFKPESGIEVDNKSKDNNNTEFGNEIKYNCVLTIPKDLSDDGEDIEYPYQVLYNGLKSPVMKHKVHAWFFKKFEVVEDESQRVLEGGNLTFVFNINNVQVDATIVKIDVFVSADTLNVQREDKMTERRYKYKVYNLKEGINNVVVQVLEEGCPPASFPFEVEYHKPVAKTRTTPEEKEKVVIKKKRKVVPQQYEKPVMPQLEI